MSAADIAAAAAQAAAAPAKYGVPADIHADDFIYQFYIESNVKPDPETARANVTTYYFSDGDRSAQRLDGLIRQFHPEAAARRLALLEFASGYGCVSRHLRRMADRYELVACDIHPQAIEFLRDRLDVDGVLSRSQPAEFAAPRQFDVVFCLSFFSHMPDRTFGDWIEALFSSLSENGLLVFTTHGREAHGDVGRPALDPAGFWFAPLSEQKDIPTDEYGCMIVTPSYVMQRIARCRGATLVLFQAAAWWDKQDLFIVRKTTPAFP